MHATGDGGFVAAGVDWGTLAKRRGADEPWDDDHADLAASLQRVVEETCSSWPAGCTSRPARPGWLMAGGVALNCVANTRSVAETPFEQRLGAAGGRRRRAPRSAAPCTAAVQGGDPVSPMPGADLGRGFTDDQIEAALRTARVPYERPPTSPTRSPRCLAENGDRRLVPGPQRVRAARARPPVAARAPRPQRQPGPAERRQGPRAVPPGRADGAAWSARGEIFSRGPIPSPYMLFVHDVAPQWRDRIPAVVHVDGTARIQTVDAASEPLIAAHAERFEQRTGLPVVVNTSLNTAGRPMVDDIKRRARVLRLDAGRPAGDRAVRAAPTRADVRP